VRLARSDDFNLEGGEFRPEVQRAPLFDRNKAYIAAATFSPESTCSE
jgi:hypothetical protein